jgi:hypothetical protein
VNEINPDMNGNSSSDIQIFRPFEEAFELTRKILFQPFDLTKWCVIGFAAFLSNLGGGYSFNYNFNQGSSAQKSTGLHDVMATFNQIPHWLIILGGLFLVIMVFTIFIVFAWLRARGRFMFIDCIVKNRGAIAEPWREFRSLANSFFLFSLLVACILLGVIALLTLPFAILLYKGVMFAHVHGPFIVVMAILWLMAVISFALVWALMAQIMVTVMYCRRCKAYEAFWIAWSLIATHPGEILLYCLFWLVLGLAAAVSSCLATCATCCIVIIPYVGTVILLPMFVCLRGFSLLFIRQFGSDFDVWRGQPPMGTVLPLPPPLPA